VSRLDTTSRASATFGKGRPCRCSDNRINGIYSLQGYRDLLAAAIERDMQNRSSGAATHRVNGLALETGPICGSRPDRELTKPEAEKWTRRRLAHFPVIVQSNIPDRTRNHQDRHSHLRSGIYINSIEYLVRSSSNRNQYERWDDHSHSIVAGGFPDTS
jgi:hypothetical protein